MSQTDFARLSRDLVDALGLQSPPLAIRFSDEPPPGVPAYDAPMPPPTADGRTGRVPAGCVFWMKATGRTFTTVAEDHGNCSVGSVTHGFKTLAEVADRSDLCVLVDSGWVTREVFPQIPAVTRSYRHVTYGPLAETPAEPDVVFLRLNAKQAMVLSDALPGLRFEGKPQCHIIPVAKEQNQVAVSVGCMLSRVRTAMPNTEMTCAIPGSRLAEVVQRVKTTGAVDGAVAGYAGEDARRFDTAR
jgi:uncharacterized protein (DUF169 family)